MPFQGAWDMRSNHFEAVAKIGDKFRVLNPIEG